ncbi:unnamed protein product [Phytophthora lilii]|uniref:Unnamed protein product n=1 Tax=Phytophthora lilii TaxID=2077276 RepID=A0A9W6YIR3_9STRA|nr:unnamed protein product [Phytophthora lilii]
MLDDKKMRSSAKYKTKEISTIKSLSYSRIYDDKKQFVIHKQTRPRPATTVQLLLPGDSVSKYDGTMFLPPPIEPTHERARAGLQRYHQVPGDTTPVSPPPAPSSTTSMSKAPQSPSKYRAAPYLSMYDRLAQSNGIPTNRPITPSVKPIANPSPAPSQPEVAVSTRAQLTDQHGPARLRKPTPDFTSEDAAATTPRYSSASRGAASHHERWPESEQHQQQRRIPPSAHSLSTRRSSKARIDAPSPAGHTLDDKQRNVLSVIQNLIQHKRQTLATLGAQKVGSGGTPTRSREYNLAGQIVR